MTRAAPPTCKRRGCECQRERWMLVCADCWTEVPAADRARYTRARRAHLTRIAKEIGAELLRALGRKPAGAPRTAPIDPFTNIARLTGDRDAMEPAE